MKGFTEVDRGFGGLSLKLGNVIGEQLSKMHLISQISASLVDLPRQFPPAQFRDRDPLKSNQIESDPEKTQNPDTKGSFECDQRDQWWRPMTAEHWDGAHRFSMFFDRMCSCNGAAVQFCAVARRYPDCAAAFGNDGDGFSPCFLHAAGVGRYSLFHKAAPVHLPRGKQHLKLRVELPITILRSSFSSPYRVEVQLSSFSLNGDEVCDTSYFLKYLDFRF
jgi:hypothetical protein